MKKTILKLCITAAMALAIFSCKKEHPLTTKTTRTSAAVPTPTFDYEHADYMPTPAGTSPILVPWAAGSNQLFNPEIAFDFKHADGWSLVYNTFNTTQLSPPYYFALYNKYRGILRFYLYIPPGSPTPSTYFTDGLSLAGTGISSSLAFGQDVADVATPLKSIAKIQSYQIQSTGAWYATQYEVAYDPGISGQNQQNLNFVWNINSVNLSSVTLNGTSNGTLTGTLGKASSGGFNLGSLLNAAETGVLFATGLGELSLVKLGTSAIAKSISEGVSSGLSGAVKGVLSAVIGGTPSSPQAVNITLATKINLTGSIASSSGIANPTLIIPGIPTNTNTVGYLPAYTDILGVVNMTSRPQFHFSCDSVTQTTHFLGGSITTSHYKNHIQSVGSSATVAPLNIKFNPVVTSDGTTIQVTRQDIVIPFDTLANPQPPYAYKPIFTTFPANAYHALEKIGTQYYVVVDDTSNGAVEIDNDEVWQGKGVPVDAVRYRDAALRLTILVTPPGGTTTPITLIKTFKADLVP